MKKYEEEEVVNMSNFLRKDFSNVTPNQLESKSGKLEADLSIQVKSLERYNNALHILKQDLTHATKSSLKALDDFKSSNWSFVYDIYSNLKTSKSIFVLQFLRLLGYKKNLNFEFYTFAELTNRLEVFQPQNISSNEALEISEILKFESPNKYAEVVKIWINNVLEYKVWRTKIESCKENIVEINKKIQKTLVSINNISKDKDRVFKQKNDIKRYLETDNNHFFSTETSTASKIKYSCCSSYPDNIKTKNKHISFPLIEIDSDGFYNKFEQKCKDNDYANILCEDASELKGCSFNYFCC